MKKIFLSFLVICTSIFLLNCSEDNCFTPAENTVFEFVNAAGENLIKNGTLDKSKISVQQKEDNGNSTDIKTTIGEDNKISLVGIGWNDGIKNYDVHILTDPVKTFNLKVSSSKLTGSCGGYKINSFVIENIKSTKETGYYKIIIE